MANFVRHTPPEWEFVRRESVVHKKCRDAAEKQLIEINRSKTDGLWWADQRYVDREEPFCPNKPNFLDPFNYRYQVYACPPVQNASVSLSEATEKRPLSYNVKRIAMDKVWIPGQSVCSHHWSKNPWQMQLCPPIRSDKVDKDGNKNNNKHSNSPRPSIGHFDDMCLPHPPNQIAVSNKNTDTDVHCSGSDLYKYQNSAQHHSASEASRYDSQDFCIANRNTDQSASNILHEQECSSKYDAGRRNVNSCNSAKSKDNFSVGLCDNSGKMSPNNRLEQKPNQGGSAHALVIKGKDNDRRIETYASLRAIASYNKDRANRDTIACLLANQNNNRRAAPTRDWSETILVDNLIFNHMNATKQNPKYAENHVVKMAKCQNPNISSHGQDGFLNILPRSVHSVLDYFLCRNNNAECEHDTFDRPQCVPGHYSESACLSKTPYQTVVPPETRGNTYTNRSTSCLELLGHLESNTNPLWASSQGARQEIIRTCDMYEQINIENPNRGYMTYKIIGGKQYRLPPPKDYVSKVKLPPDLEEYREFSRRCPNPTIGRYDKTDPANEMLLPSHRTMNLMKASRNPFMYTRNPKCYGFAPIFHEPRETDSLCWRLPSNL